MLYVDASTWEGFLIEIERQSTSCVRSCLMYGSETWPVKMEHEVWLDRNETSMIRWMYAERKEEKYRAPRIAVIGSCQLGDEEG